MSNDQILLDQCVKSFRGEHLEGDYEESTVFELFALSQIFKGRRLDYEEIEQGIVDGNMEGGFDGVFVIHNDDVVATVEESEDVDVNRRNQRLEIHLLQIKRTASFAESTIDKMIVSTELIFEDPSGSTVGSW